MKWCTTIRIWRKKDVKYIIYYNSPFDSLIRMETTSIKKAYKIHSLKKELYHIGWIVHSNISIMYAFSEEYERALNEKIYLLQYK